MKCEQIAPYLPGFAGGELRADTRRAVADHVATCTHCRAEATRQSNVVASLAALSANQVEPPAYLLDAVLESVQGRSHARFLPPLPVVSEEVARLVSEHRDTIASAAGTALVAAGAAYALWRAVRRPRRLPAIS